MEHPRIDDERIVDRYLVGRLTPEEEALFEEHLFHCTACLEQVESGQELSRGLRAVAAEEAARARAVTTLGLMARIRSRPVRFAGLALACLLLPALLLWQRLQLNRLQGGGGPEVVAGLIEPTGDLLVVALGVVRGTADAVELRLDPDREIVLLSLELQAVESARYRVILSDAGGAVLWRGDDLEPNLHDSLLLALPSSYLGPGSYRVTVIALPETGDHPTGEMEFRVLPAQ